MNTVNSPYDHIPAWVIILFCLLLAYRSIIATLLEAFHALSSLQRRMLLEDDSIGDPDLENELEKPHGFGLGIAIWQQITLVCLMGLIWPFYGLIPGRGWTLALGFFIYLLAMDFTIPTLLAGRDPASWLRRCFPFYAPVRFVLMPLIAPLTLYVERSRDLQDKIRDDEPEPDYDEGMEALLEEGEAEGILEEEDRELIRNVVGFGDTVVRELMTPRTSMQAIDTGASSEEVWAAFRASRHSRMPLVEGSPDQIVGVLRLKELIQLENESTLDIRALAKPALFVPESKYSLDLLREMQVSRNQMAIVVDEFGSVSGLVTLEDLLVAIFGEIREEHDIPAEIQEGSGGDLRVSGQTHVEDLEKRLEVEWEREGFDTVAGLIMSRLGHVPVVHESIDVEGARLTVLEMDGPRILVVKVERLR